MLYNFIPSVHAVTGIPGTVNENSDTNGNLPTRIGVARDTILAKFVGWMIKIFWIATVGFLIWAAFLYLTAGGIEDNVTKAKKYIIYALIAAAVALLSTVIDDITRNLLKGGT